MISSQGNMPLASLAVSSPFLLQTAVKAGSLEA